MIVHDSWWSNRSTRFNYDRLSSAIIDYHWPFDQGLRVQDLIISKKAVLMKNQINSKQIAEKSEAIIQMLSLGLKEFILLHGFLAVL